MSEFPLSLSFHPGHIWTPYTICCSHWRVSPCSQWCFRRPPCIGHVFHHMTMTCQESEYEKVSWVPPQCWWTSRAMTKQVWIRAQFIGTCCGCFFFFFLATPVKQFCKTLSATQSLSYCLPHDAAKPWEWNEAGTHTGLFLVIIPWDGNNTPTCALWHVV